MSLLLAVVYAWDAQLTLDTADGLVGHGFSPQPTFKHIARLAENVDINKI